MEKSNASLELWIGKVLLGSVIIALIMIVVGGMWYLSLHAKQPFDEQLFRGESLAYASLKGVWLNVLSPLGLIQGGLLLIIGGQLLRVALTVGIFYRQRDIFFAVITFVILSIMLAGFCCR